ncbi:MAG: hypothetical protein ACKO4T_10845, partial [Planctomycetaceae bacterium]
AREVYGEHNPQWLLFRAWLLTEAPTWLRDAYVAHGQDVAAWIHDKPLAKTAIKSLMDLIVGQYEATMPTTSNN